MVHHPDSSEEPSDTVANLRSHVLAQQFRRVRVDRRHVSIELVPKFSRELLKPNKRGNVPPCCPAW